jgi:outer membrane protein assembly factor BamB
MAAGRDLPEATFACLTTFTRLGGAVYALDAATGAMLWSFATPGRPQSSVAVANGVVYAVTMDDNGLLGSAYALSAATGQKLWHFSSPGPLSTPVVANGILYAGLNSGTTQARLLALAAANGKVKVLWQSQIIGLDQSWPAVAGGLVYAGDTHGDVDAFNATTGKLAWQFPTPSGAGVEATPAVANGIVYDSAEDGTLYALGANTGQKLASFPLGTATISAATVADGAVYVGNYDQHLYALALPASAT